VVLDAFIDLVFTTSIDHGFLASGSDLFETDAFRFTGLVTDAWEASCWNTVPWCFFVSGKIIIPSVASWDFETEVIDALVSGWWGSSSNTADWGSSGTAITAWGSSGTAITAWGSSGTAITAWSSSGTAITAWGSCGTAITAWGSCGTAITAWGSSGTAITAWSGSNWIANLFTAIVISRIEPMNFVGSAMDHSAPSSVTPTFQALATSVFRGRFDKTFFKVFTTFWLWTLNFSALFSDANVFMTAIVDFVRNQVFVELTFWNFWAVPVKTLNISSFTTVTDPTNITLMVPRFS
jgi:hypothetical protein